jgi:peptidoglycan hydrolase-like protein with peptidoglycan-binding domain
MLIIQKQFNWSGALAKRSTIDMIVLHHANATNCTVDQIHEWHLANNWSGFGYHYFIDKNGQIFKGRPDDTIGSHAKGYNSTSIGICFEGNFEKETPTQVQMNAGLELVEYLKRKYGIKTIKGHGELMATACPGKLFDINQFRGVKENLVLSFQMASYADGFRYPRCGTDGIWGLETKGVARQCIVKKRLIHKYPNATKLVQRLLGVDQDGKCGPITSLAIKDFQRKNGLEIDGAVGAKTWKKLLGVN